VAAIGDTAGSSLTTGALVTFRQVRLDDLRVDDVVGRRGRRAGRGDAHLDVVVEVGDQFGVDLVG